MVTPLLLGAHFASFSFFAAEGLGWSANVWSYDADGCGVSHLG